MSTSLAVAELGGPNALAQRRPVPGLIRPIARPDELLSSHEEVRNLIAQTLQDGRDYGKIPGTGDKPALLKPGAERVTMAFGCYSRFSVMEKEVDHDREVPWLKRKKRWTKKGEPQQWDETRGVSLGLYRYVVLCEIVHRESETVVGSCLASCSTMESKYIDRPRDSENTVLKMAEKRAHVGAVLNAFGLSEQFTQDVEENPGLYQRNGEGAEEQAPPPPDVNELAAKVRKMVADLRALDGQAGAEAEVYAEGVLQADGVTEEQVKAAGARLLARLNKARAAVAQPAEPLAIPDPQLPDNPPASAPEPAPAPRNGKSATISEGQVKRFWVIAKGAGYTDVSAHRMLAAEYQLGSASEITRDIYEAVCESAADEELAYRYASDPDQADAFAATGAPASAPDADDDLPF